MAKVGAGAAGLQLSYNESKMPQITQYWGGKGIEEQDKIKAGKAAQEAAKRKNIDEWGKEFKPEDIAVNFSKYGDYDNAVFGLGEQIADRYAQIHRSAMYGSDEDKREARLKMNKLKRAVSMVNTGTALMGEKFASFQKASDEGKVSGADRFGRILEPVMVDGRVSLELNEDLVPVILTVDKEGNQFKVPYTEIVDGSFTHMEKNDLLKDADTMLKQVGTDVSKYIGGDRTVELKQWNDRQASTARELIDAKIKTSPSVMSDYLYQITEKEGDPVVKYNGFTKDEYQKVSDFMYSMIKGGYDKYRKESPTSKSDRSYGFGYNNDGKLLASPILDTETGNLDAQTINIGGKAITQGLGINLNTKVRNSLKTLFENEPNTRPSAVLLGEDDNLYVRVSEQGSDRREVDGEDIETNKNKRKTLVNTTKPIKKTYQYRRLDNTQGTAISNALGGETVIDLKNYIKSLPEQHGLPINIKGQEQGIGTKRTFGQGISSFDTPLPEEARAVTRTVDGETYPIEDKQPVQSVLPKVTKGGFANFNKN